MLPSMADYWRKKAKLYEAHADLLRRELQKRGSLFVEHPSDELARLRAENDQLKRKLQAWEESQKSASPPP